MRFFFSGEFRVESGEWKVSAESACRVAQPCGFGIDN